MNGKPTCGVDAKPSTNGLDPGPTGIPRRSMRIWRDRATGPFHAALVNLQQAAHMRERKNLTISDDARKRGIASVRAYFDENMDEPIGDLKAALLLDWFVAEHGPAIYNQAVADAQHYFEERVADLPAICNYPEHPLSSRTMRKAT
jgi:uncharacterized protein (DUF2164 family)